MHNSALYNLTKPYLCSGDSVACFTDEFFCCLDTLLSYQPSMCKRSAAPPHPCVCVGRPVGQLSSSVAPPHQFGQSAPSYYGVLKLWVPRAGCTMMYFVLRISPLTDRGGFLNSLPIGIGICGATCCGEN